jgi:hypothetical protein
MNCNAFFLWIKKNTSTAIQENPEALAHIQTCPACRQMYELDACLESCIQQAFTPHRLPAGLVETIDACLDPSGSAGRHMDPPGLRPLKSVNMDEPCLRENPPNNTGHTKIQPKNNSGH